MSASILEASEQFVHSLLERSLDKRLYYHNLLHTINAVKYASLLAHAEGLSKEDTELVLIAEWFHDTGFTVTYDGHEEASVQIASDFLKPLLPGDQIKKITDCILATKKGSVPENILHYIMHDADYYHLFEPEYFQLIDNLKKEVNELSGKIFTAEQWYEHNAAFLSQHYFYTRLCKSRWGQHKEILLSENSKILNEINRKAN